MLEVTENVQKNKYSFPTIKEMLAARASEAADLKRHRDNNAVVEWGLWVTKQLR